MNTSIIQQAANWVFGKPLAITILILFNLYSFYCIKILFDKMNRIENKLIETLDTTVRENSKALNRFNDEIDRMNRTKYEQFTK